MANASSNYYTEDKAKELWCPMTRGSDKMELTNRKNKSPNFNCIAGLCSWWIWIDDTYGRCGHVNLPDAEAKSAKKNSLKKK